MERERSVVGVGSPSTGRSAGGERGFEKGLHLESSELCSPHCDHLKRGQDEQMKSWLTWKVCKQVVPQLREAVIG